MFILKKKKKKELDPSRLREEWGKLRIDIVSISSLLLAELLGCSVVVDAAVLW